MGSKPELTNLGSRMQHLRMTTGSLLKRINNLTGALILFGSTESLLKRIDYLAGALRELETSERAANAFIMSPTPEKSFAPAPALQR